jgi:hypothetical protein
VKNPEAGGGRAIALRGVSWIVTGDARGALIAMEIASGAVVAGPFATDRDRLEALVGRVMAGTSVH